MRQYQEDIYNALVNKSDWYGNKTCVETSRSGISEIHYCSSKIGVVNHMEKTAKLDNCGYTNASTTARINAIKEFCNDYGYTY